MQVFFYAMPDTTIMDSCIIQNFINIFTNHQIHPHETIHGHRLFVEQRYIVSYFINRLFAKQATLSGSIAQCRNED